MNRRLSLALVGLAVLVGVLFFAFARGFGRDPHEVPFMLKGKPAPDFALTRLDTGEPVTLAQLRGEPVVLNFWASWCGPCKLEHPTLSRAARRHQGDARFYGVVFEDTPENARAFAQPMDPSFPQLVDPHSRMAVDYGVTGVPETYFIDAQGVIREKYVGPLLDEAELTRRLRALSGPRASGAGQ
ncbi:MAG TPA: redoxin domain-containing protein [Myxococcaceae bacterium]|nr:redoxin domain-containing protein [Myxococcaceae bacterium]